MKKAISKITAIILFAAVLFSGCSAAVSDKGTTAPVTKPEATIRTYAESVASGNEQKVTVSDEVIDSVKDTDEEIKNDKDIATDETIPASEADEKAVADEGAIEPDASVEQENISYDGTNTGKGSALLSGSPNLTYYSQADSRWASVPYTSSNNKSQTIKSSGCGPTSAAMVISASKGIITPPTVAQLFVDNGYRTKSNGTAWSAWSFVADYFDFKEYHTASSVDKMLKYLKQDENKDNVSDYFVVASCGSGLFTTGGHYIVLFDDKDGTISVYDPYLYSGKYNTASRKAAKVKVSGTTAYVSESSFKKYANSKNFWIFSNDSKAETKKEKTSGKRAGSTVMYVNTKSGSLNVRNGAGTNHSKTGSLKKGTKVTVSKTAGSWSCITSPKKGWVSSQYLSKKKPSAETNSKSAPQKIAYVYIPATGRYAYCKYSAIKNGRLKNDTALYSKPDLSGKKYNYLAKTKVVVKKTL